MMNAMKVAARISSNPKFHSTPLLCIKKRTYWGSGRNNDRGLNSKATEESLNSSNVRHVFIKWHGFTEFINFFFNRMRTTSLDSKQGDFEFCDIDDDDGDYYENDDDFMRGKAKKYKGPRTSRRDFIDDDFESFSSDWRNHCNEECDYDFSSEYEKTVTNLTSERLALGLSLSGPLNLKDVKNAYRACALKWHPDRHQGSSKVVAEENFKLCSAAYQTLCDKMALRT